MSKSFIPDLIRLSPETIKHNPDTRRSSFNVQDLKITSRNFIPETMRLSPDTVFRADSRRSSISIHPPKIIVMSNSFIPEKTGFSPDKTGLSPERSTPLTRRSSITMHGNNSDQVPASQDIQSSLIQLKERLIQVSDEKERIKIKETMNEINILLSQPSHFTSFVGIENNYNGRTQTNISDKATWQKLQRKKLKIERNLQQLYLFYILQYPSHNDHSNKKTVENSDMNLSMFMMFVKQFHILGQDTRQPTDKNDLEKKRRGLPGKIDQHLSHSIQKLPNHQDGLLDYSSYKDQLKQSYVAHYQHVESRHKFTHIYKIRWWNDEEFYRYYNPQNLEQPKQYKALSTTTLMQIFKKNAFQGKTATYAQFNQILTVIALNIYPNSEEQDLTLRFFIEVLSLHKTKKMKRNQYNIHHAFNITEKIGYRYEPPKKSTPQAKPYLNIVQNKLAALPDNKIMTKLLARVNEVEEMEAEQNQKSLKQHESLIQKSQLHQERYLAKLQK